MNINNPYGFYGPGFHKYVIDSIVKYTNCKTYLELGVYDGDTFSLIAKQVNRAIAVDIKDLRLQKIGEFYQMSTDEFFKNFSDNVDIVFIDADHNSNSVIKDFENSLKLLNKYGIIFLHDTDPMEKKLLEPGYCNDCFKTVDYIMEKHPELNIITLPLTDAGLSIIMRKNDRRVLNFI